MVWCAVHLHLRSGLRCSFPHRQGVACSWLTDESLPWTCPWPREQPCLGYCPSPGSAHIYWVLNAGHPGLAPLPQTVTASASLGGQRRPLWQLFGVLSLPSPVSSLPRKWVLSRKPLAHKSASESVSWGTQWEPLLWSLTSLPQWQPHPLGSSKALYLYFSAFLIVLWQSTILEPPPPDWALPEGGRQCLFPLYVCSTCLSATVWNEWVHEREADNRENKGEEIEWEPYRQNEIIQVLLHRPMKLHFLLSLSIHPPINKALTLRSRAAALRGTFGNFSQELKEIRILFFLLSCICKTNLPFSSPSLTLLSPFLSSRHFSN